MLSVRVSRLCYGFHLTSTLFGLISDNQDLILAFIVANALQRVQQGDDGHTSGSIDITEFSPRSYYPAGLNQAESGAFVLVPELQFARCMSNRYKSEGFPRCVACTRRWAGDTCRFQGIRYFMRDQEGKLMGISFNEASPSSESSKMEFPTRWNRKFEREHIRRTKVSGH